MDKSMIDGIYIPDGERYEKHMTTKEIAEHFGVCRATIDDWRKIGLPCHQARPNGRCYFLLRECNAWLFSKKPPKTCGDTSPTPQVHLLSRRRNG